MDGDDLQEVMARAMPLSMAPEAAVRFTAEQAVDAIGRGLPGALVECGVWRGGASAGMLLAQQARLGRVERTVYMLDSFEGLPPATERDGPLARTWQQDTTSPIYYDNCAASFDGVLADMAALELPEGSYELVRGWFADTVPELAVRLAGEGIALLRLDGDWYDSTMVCLEHLVPLLAEEGVIVLDDYYAWDGCARATHDFLSRHDLPYRIRDVPGPPGMASGAAGAYVVKRAARADAL